MPRNSRVDVGGEIYHVTNRANGRLQIFNNDSDYKLFEELLTDTKELIGMRILAYSIMPNHFHLILYPINDGDLGLFMHRLCNSHTRKVHALTNTNGTGHLYQGRYKSFLVDKDKYLNTLIKYVERNPVRANLLKLCEKWKWGSAYRRIYGTQKEKALLDQSSFNLPDNYLNWINTIEKEDTLNDVRFSVIKGVPYGREAWVNKMIDIYHLESTTKFPGRPKKG